MEDKIYTIIDKVTGEELFGTKDISGFPDNLLAVEELRTTFFVYPFFNQETRQFYEGASQEEIDTYNNEQQNL